MNHSLYEGAHSMFRWRQFAQGNSLVHLSFLLRQNRHETGSCRLQTFGLSDVVSSARFMAVVLTLDQKRGFET